MILELDERRSRTSVWLSFLAYLSHKDVFLLLDSTLLASLAREPS